MKRITPWVLWGGLCLSILLNVVLYQAARTFYNRESKFRLHPTGTPSFMETGPESSVRVMLLGDSRCAQWSGFAPHKYRVINAGVGNETTAQIRLRAVEAISKVRPSVVVLEAGINDLKTIPLIPDKEKEVIENCVTNLMELVRESRERGASVIVLSVLPVGRVELGRRLVWSDAVARSVDEVNKRLVEKCSSTPGVSYFDVSSHVLVDQDYKDALHFTPGFYARISPLVERAIDDMLNPAPL